MPTKRPRDFTYKSGIKHLAWKNIDVLIYPDVSNQTYTLYLCHAGHDEARIQWEATFSHLSKSEKEEIQRRIQRIVRQVDGSFGLKQNIKAYTAWVKQCTNGTCRLYVKRCDGDDSQTAWKQVCSNTLEPSCASKVRELKVDTDTQDILYAYTHSRVGPPFNMSRLVTNIVISMEHLMDKLKLSDASLTGLTQKIADAIEYDDNISTDTIYRGPHNVYVRSSDPSVYEESGVAVVKHPLSNGVMLRDDNLALSGPFIRNGDTVRIYETEEKTDSRGYKLASVRFGQEPSTYGYIYHRNLFRFALMTYKNDDGNTKKVRVLTRNIADPMVKLRTLYQAYDTSPESYLKFLDSVERKHLQGGQIHV